jgi:hypothetical protein
MLYTIELNYNAKITKVVDAKDEGDALEKARQLAEDSDMTEFIITEEKESRVINR